MPTETENPIATTAEHTTAPADESVFASLGLNGQLFVFQLFNFAVVAVIVWFLILKPLTKKMEERRVIIDDSLDKAKEIEAKFVASQKEYQEAIAQAKNEANQIMAAAKAEAVTMGEKMKQETKTDIDQLVKQAKTNIQADREVMMKEAKGQIAGIVIASMEKILGKKITATIDEALVEKTVQEVDEKNV